MKKFEQPSIEITRFAISDIIASSENEFPIEPFSDENMLGIVEIS